MARVDVLGQHLQAPHQVLAALGERRAQKLRIGGEEVRGRERRGDLPQIELRFLAIVRIELVGALDQIVGPARRQHVGLLDEIEIRIVAPRGVGEALVGGVGRGDRRRLFALEALQGRSPEVDELLGQRRLRRERPLGIGHVIFGHAADGAHHLADFIGDRGLDLAALPRRHIGGQRLAALLDRLRDVVCERLHIGGRVLAARAGRLGAERAGGGAASLAGSGGAAGAVKRMGSAGAGAVSDFAWLSPLQPRAA